MHSVPIKPAPASAAERGFWEQPWFLAAFVLLAALPLVWPDVPPFVDLPGHMGRYKVQLELANSPFLQRYYDFQWSLIGNLGVDLLVMPLARLFGLELAVKLIVIAIPPLTVAGFLWVAREVHGRIPPTALFAAPLAYGYPLIFGFVNFALSMAFAFLAFGLWLRLARQGRFRLRAILFVPLSGLIWVTHTFGWGTLGLLAFSAELVRQHDNGRGFIASAFRSGIHCLSIAPPILLMLFWRSGQVSGITADLFNWQAKLHYLLIVFRDRWLVFDVAALGVVSLLILRAMRSPRIGFSRNLAASALILTTMFVLLPRIVFGSAYADMRLAPYLFAVALVAIRLRDWTNMRFAKTVAIVALGFVLVRTTATTISFWLYDREWDRHLAALDALPQNARLLSFVGNKCRHGWYIPRLDHLPALALVRNTAFSNDQWTMAGAQLLRVNYPQGGRFVKDPSQIVLENTCWSPAAITIDQALRRFPRNAFDYVWLIDPPEYDPALTRGLRPIWRNGTSALFKVER